MVHNLAWGSVAKSTLANPALWQGAQYGKLDVSLHSFSVDTAITNLLVMEAF